MTEHLEDNGGPRQETLGTLFQRTRRSQHKTLEEAAEATRIHLSALEALETDDFDSLPAEVFTRGFIKLYAKYLGLDPSETLAHYISQENADPEKPADRPYRRDILDGEAMAHPHTYFKGNRRTLTVILLLTALLAFYLLGKIYKPRGNQSELTTPETEIAQAVVEEQPQPVEGITDPAPPSGTELKVLEPRQLARKKIEPTRPDTAPAPPAGKPQSEAPDEPAPIDLPQPKPAPAPEMHKPIPGPAPSASIQTLPAPATVTNPGSSQSSDNRPFQPVTVKIPTTPVDGAEAETNAAAVVPPSAEHYILEAKFKESSWIHVEVDDQPVREYTSRADVTRVWRANRRILLKLDNAEAVELSLNGEPLILRGEPGELVTLRIPPDLP